MWWVGTFLKGGLEWIPLSVRNWLFARSGDFLRG